jgi:hypothetical protein
MLNDQTIGDVEDTMMHESPPSFQHYKPIIDITIIRKGVPTHSDDNEPVQNSFVSLIGIMPLDSWRFKLLTL